MNSEDRLRKARRESEGQTGKAFRTDGYINMLNKYGTKKDASESYTWQAEPGIIDHQLETMYESNGLFTKIIDLPAEEALKHGYDYGVSNEDIEKFVDDALDALDWDEKAATAIKWTRLFGGAIIVMLIDDGRGLEEPVDWKNIRSIDELRVYERAVVNPSYFSLYSSDCAGKNGNRVSRFGQPEFYDVFSIYGTFRVHESRCLIFRNGVLPENVSNPNYRFWGIPEYIRIRRALQETVVTHQDGPKLLERSVQPIYKMKNLSQLVATDAGAENVVKRLEVIDMARNLLNSIAIDNDGEDYDFKTFSFTGIKDVIDATCSMLSAVTNIPQNVLFGKTTTGISSTDDTSMEMYYNYVERIQKLMLRSNLRTLLDVIFTAARYTGEIPEEPKYKLTFNPLWSMSDTEQATVEKTRADTELVKAQTAQMYVDMQALDPSEVRKGLAKSGEFDVETLIDDTDLDFVDEMREPFEQDLKNISGREKLTSDILNDDASDGIMNTDDKKLKWVTMPNGNHFPLDENGKAKIPKDKSGSSTDTTKAVEKGGIGKTSPSGANTFKVKGFPSRQKLNNHWENGRTHKAEYIGEGITAKEQYEAKAVKLLESPVGGSIKGHADGHGNIIRYDSETNDFAKGNPEKGVKTMFKPIKGEEYYNQKRKEDIEHGGKT